MKYIQLTIFAAIFSAFVYGWATRIAAETESRNTFVIETRQVSPRLPEAGERQSPPAAAPGSFIDDCLDYIVQAESRGGADPKCFRGEVGPAGERGAWQVTPIYVADIKRLYSVDLDPYDFDGCRYYAGKWLEHYMTHTTVTTAYEAHQLYRRGLVGYRKWKGE